LTFHTLSSQYKGFHGVVHGLVPLVYCVQHFSGSAFASHGRAFLKRLQTVLCDRQNLL
jgi:hypothetical protein